MPLQLIEKFNSMEYIISNIRFDNCKEYNSLFYQGNFVFAENKLSLFEGFLVEPEILDVKHPEKNKGVFNNITINTKTKEINIINDKLGQLSLYYYINNNNFVISNSFWKIIQVLGSDKIVLNEKRIKELLYCHRIPLEGETFINEIKQLKASVILNINYETGILKNTKYWNIEQQSNEKLSIEDASINLEKSFDNFFSFLKEKYPNKTFAFGNSGGLDSRLVPLFAKKHDIKLIGVTIGSKRPFKILKSVSHNSALKIAKLFNFKNYCLESTSGDYANRLLLDIRNNPLSGNQIFKNPYEQLPEFDNLICGGNGFIVSNDSNLWRTFDTIPKEKHFSFLFDYLNKEKLSIPYKNSYRVKKFLNFPFKISSNNSIFRKWFNEKDIEDFKSDFKKFYAENKTLDNFSLVRQLHMSLLNKQSPNGGLESISRTKPFFYLYYPFALDEAITWDKNFFYNRKIITEIIKRNNLYLAKIPDQKLNKIIGKSGKIYKLINIVLRRSGMDYALWAKQNKFKVFAKEIVERENSFFDKILNNNKINFNDLIKTHPHFWLDVVKVKKIVDIIHFEEYDFIDKQEFFIK